jgi:ATP-binding protein involved in chromosome partitioning
MRILTGSRINTEAVGAAVGLVVEPQTGLSLEQLDAVGTVIAHRSGIVTIPVVLLTSAEPARARLSTEVAAAARTVPGVGEVEIEFAPMDQPRRMRLAQRLAAASPRVQRTPRIYAVASGKGGVGKSTITANLAAALARSGQRVGVLDADVWGYSIPHLFGVRHNPVALAGTMLPVRAHGVSLISTGFFVGEDEPVMWRGPMLHKALEQFLTDVLWGELDVLLLDLPPGTGDITLSLLELVPNAALLAVTTPQPAARSVASRVARMAREAAMPIAGVIENMTTTVCAHCGHQTALFGAGGGRQLAQQAGAPLLGQIPLDITLRDAGDRGIPVVLDAPAAPSAHALDALAHALPVARRSLLRRPLPLAVTRASTPLTPYPV